MPSYKLYRRGDETFAYRFRKQDDGYLVILIAGAIPWQEIPLGTVRYLRSERVWKVERHFDPHPSVGGPLFTLTRRDASESLVEQWVSTPVHLRYWKERE